MYGEYYDSEGGQPEEYIASYSVCTQNKCSTGNVCKKQWFYFLLCLGPVNGNFQTENKKYFPNSLPENSHFIGLRYNI